jgi:hypothetical protein
VYLFVPIIDTLPLLNILKEYSVVEAIDVELVEDTLISKSVAYKFVVPASLSTAEELYFLVKL